MCRDMRLSSISTPMTILVLAASSLLGGCGGEEEPGPDLLEAKTGSKRGGDDRGSSMLEGTETSEAPAGGNDGGEDPITPPATAPATKSATVRLDDVDMTVSEITLWAPNAEGEALVFIKFEGTGAPAGTDLVVSFTKVAKGCVASPKPKAQDVWLRPPKTADQFHSADGASCGLEITSFPANVGDYATGAFRGKVAGINGAAGKTRTLDVLFRVQRMK